MLEQQAAVASVDLPRKGELPAFTGPTPREKPSDETPRAVWQCPGHPQCLPQRPEPHLGAVQVDRLVLGRHGSAGRPHEARARTTPASGPLERNCAQDTESEVEGRAAKGEFIDPEDRDW